jgi:hypothetical protein
MIKETDSGGMIRCTPPVSEFLKSFTFVWFYVMRWPSSIQPNNLFEGPFCADANLKYEIYISNSYRKMANEIA